MKTVALSTSNDGDSLLWNHIYLYMETDSIVPIAITWVWSLNVFGGGDR